jgi:hypothetical protein
MRPRRLGAGSALVVGLGIVLAAALALSGPAGGTRSRASFDLERARSFGEFTLFDAGTSVDGLPLTAVLRRDDTANFVSFVYGDCVAGDDAGCAPPVEIQVWPACARNLALYDAGHAAAGPAPEPAVVRGVPGALFDGGTRLELETGRSTVVVFAGSRARVLRVAAALRAVDGSVRRGAPLPPAAAYARGGAMGC